MIYYQTLRTEIKRDVGRSVMRSNMCNKDDVVNSICQLNMGCLTCPVSGSNLPAVILNLHLSVFSVRYVIINPVFFFIPVWSSKYQCISAPVYKSDICACRIVRKLTVPFDGFVTSLTGEIRKILLCYL